MDDTTQPPQALDHEISDEISLLDILVTLAENIKLLILGPLAAGFLALGISFAWPQTFESVAVMQAEPAIASLLTTAVVLDPVADSLGLRNSLSAEQAREHLRSRIKTSVGRNDKLLTLTVAGNSPAQAQATATALLDAAYEQSRPKGSQKARLERQLAEAQSRLQMAQATAAHTAAQLAQAEVGQTPARPAMAVQQRSDALDLLAGGFAGFLEASSAAQKQIVEIEVQLDGLTDAQVMQPPTLPEKAVSPKKGLTAVIAALATGFLLVILVFVRSGLRGLQDAESVSKLSRIRRSLGLRSQA